MIIGNMAQTYSRSMVLDYMHPFGYGNFSILFDVEY